MSADEPRPVVDPLAHPICLTWPERRTAVRSWHEHIPFAMFLVDLLRPSVLVELGVHAGDSYCAWCQAVKSLNLDTRCYGVDAWYGDPRAGFYDAGVLDDLLAHHEPRYGGFSSLIRGTFDDALARFADGTIGLLHIDGDHTYEAVKHDFTSWRPKLRADGVVLLHDTNVEGRGFGVRRFWDEIKSQYRYFEFQHGHGLGVLAVGDVRSPELGALLDAKPDDAERIQALFAELGQRLSLQDDVDALELRLREAQQALATGDRTAPSLAGPSRPPEADRAGNVLQLFWDDGGGFSEAHSLSTPLIADDQIHQHTMRLPSTARGPMRLDPGNRAAYVEIHGIELVACRDETGDDGEIACRWSAARGDAALIPGSGITWLGGGGVYRFLCDGEDPRLVLDGVPARDDPRPWLVRVTLRASERVLEIVADEIGHLERQAARMRRRRRESDTALVSAHARLAEQAAAAQALEARADTQAWASAAALRQWRAERRRLGEQLADHERERRAQHVELARVRQLLTRLEARAAEQRGEQHTENARLRAEVKAAERTAHSLSAELGLRKGQLLETDRQLRAHEDLLHRITDSPGWGALNRYRRLKHRLLRPGPLLREAWEALVGREYRPGLGAMHDLRWLSDSGVWESTGRDPQFNLPGPWPAGWTEITLDMEVETRVTGRARLYVDRGAGYIESDSYELGEGAGHRARFVRLGPDVIGLRLDPCESTGRFRVSALTLKRVTARRASRGSLSVPGAPAGDVVDVPGPLDPFEAWLEVNEWNARRAGWLGAQLSALAEPPLLSIVMPIYDPLLPLLDRAIASVVAQVYQRWELCIADDASTDVAVRETLQRWAEREPRIRVVFRETNGDISRATNSAADLARGDFLAFMDQDDEITPDALGEIALYLAEHPETDVVYSDDDKIDAEGRRFAPQFKPDWSPELLLSYMYWSHLLVVRRRVFVEAGGLRVGYEGAQDYDLALRVTELTDRVGHVPKVLYHWRVLPGSTAVSGAAKPESFGAGRRAVQEALDRRSIRAVAHHPDWAVAAGCGIFVHEFPDEGPRVAVIIPTRNNVALLRACLTSLAQTTYKNYEIMIADNGSDDAETLAFLGRTPHLVRRIPNPEGRFNFAAINNRAVEETDADLVMFLNDDTEVVEPKWLSQMVGYLGLPGVGAVGARLRFPDGRVQHAGVVHGYYGGLAGPAFKLLPAATHGYLSYAMVARNYSAVTAACLLTRRELFSRLGGFDARRFGVAYNDVDFCYRLGAAGYRVVYCPTAELIHHEGASRGFVDDPAEPAAFRRTYGGRRDPFYNPNLSLDHERFAIDARTLAPERLPPIRTLMCAFTLNLEGAPNSQLELTMGLKEAGVIEPIVYCPQDGPLRAAYEAHGIRVDVFEHPLSAAGDVAAYEQAVARFSEWMAAANVELVYGNTLETFYAIEAAQRLGLPSIWNPRESEPWETYFEPLGPPGIAAHALRCFGYPYKVIFVADATRRGFAPLDRHRNFMTIHTGLNRERFLAALDRWPRGTARDELGIAPDEIAIVLPGTVCERKGQLDLVEAMACLDEPSASRIRCFVVGDRPNEYSTRVWEAWQTLPAARRSRLKIVAATPEIALYYAASDVFVCTSRIESFPRVILEALAAGLPIVTTLVYGIAEQVQEHVNALCYVPGDVPALTAHLAQLCREPHLRRQLGDSSRHVLDALTDFDAMVAAYARVFREAWLSGKSR